CVRITSSTPKATPRGGGWWGGLTFGFSAHNVSALAIHEVSYIVMSWRQRNFDGSPGMTSTPRGTDAPFAKSNRSYEMQEEAFRERGIERSGWSIGRGTGGRFVRVIYLLDDDGT